MIPRKRLGVGLRHPWHLLQAPSVTESIFIETDKAAGVLLTAAKNYWRRRNQPGRFTTRTVVRDGKRGVCIWRIE